MNGKWGFPSMTRRAALAGGSLALGFPFAARSQGTQPTPEKLSQIVEKALAEPRQVRFARPQVLGFPDELVTQQYGIRQNSVDYYFAVQVPRQPDGLILFSRHENPDVFNMHRTDTHLRRVTSARNFRQQGGGLTAWNGSDCDADFAEQLAVWARVRL